MTSSLCASALQNPRRPRALPYRRHKRSSPGSGIDVATHLSVSECQVPSLLVSPLPRFRCDARGPARREKKLFPSICAPHPLRPTPEYGAKMSQDGAFARLSYANRGPKHQQHLQHQHQHSVLHTRNVYRFTDVLVPGTLALYFLVYLGYLRIPV